MPQQLLARRGQMYKVEWSDLPVPSWISRDAFLAQFSKAKVRRRSICGFKRFQEILSSGCLSRMPDLKGAPTPLVTLRNCDSQTMQKLTALEKKIPAKQREGFSWSGKAIPAAEAAKRWAARGSGCIWYRAALVGGETISLGDAVKVSICKAWRCMPSFMKSCTSHALLS
eukprot:SAG11_NODE_126_length_15729_cov_9.966859_15_plen_170_part_00